MWLTVGPHWIHDGIYPDSAIPGKLTVRILLLIQGVAWIIVCGKVVFSLITTYILIQRVGPPKILRILCSGLLREMVSVEFSYLSFSERHYVCCSPSGCFCRTGQLYPQCRHPLYWPSLSHICYLPHKKRERWQILKNSPRDKILFTQSPASVGS